jgi:hypothetical protein
MLKSENARLSGWVYIDLHGRDQKTVPRRSTPIMVASKKQPGDSLRHDVVRGGPCGLPQDEHAIAAHR